MKKTACFLLALLLMVSMTSCGTKPEGNAPETQTPPPESESVDGDEERAGLDAMNDLEVESGIFNVTLTIPADFVGEGATQEDCDKIAAENGYQSVTLNEDGSATYVVTKAQHNKMMEDVTNSINESLNSLVGSEEYPDIVSIEANSDYTEYTVVTKSEEVGVMESIVTIGFYFYSGTYHAFNGTTVENVSVKFINEATGEVLQEANSKDME